MINRQAKNGDLINDKPLEVGEIVDMSKNAAGWAEVTLELSYGSSVTNLDYLDELDSKIFQ